MCGGFGFRWCAFRSEVALVLNVCLGVCLRSFELLGGFVLLLVRLIVLFIWRCISRLFCGWLLLNLLVC